MTAAKTQTKNNWRLPAAICLALFSLTWLVFGQTLQFGFVNYDDPEWVTQNPHITSGLTTSGIGWAFQRLNAGALASISHMLDVQMFGLNPMGHHFTNVLLHSLASVLLFLALRRMAGSDWPSVFVAALFAIHPLRAESVAWVTERKDVLSGFFFALTLLVYVAYVERGSIARYLIVCLSFIAGLLSKGTLITLPIVLLLLDYWPLRRGERTEDRKQRTGWKSLVAEKAPLCAFSLIAAAITFASHTAGLASVQAVPFSVRLANAAVNYVVYIRQMFWPVELAAFYPFREHPSVAVVVGCLLVITGISVAAIVWRNRAPYLFTGWFWYLVMLAPISGIVQIGMQGHADRYTYLPQIGLYIVIAWGVADLSRRLRYREEIVGALGLATVVTLAFFARGAAASWHDSETLWSRAIAVAPDNDFARASLADWLLRQGRTKESIAQSEEALRINPRNADAHNHLALAISRGGRLPEAIEHWRAALEIQPENLNARCNLAMVLATAPDSSLRDGTRAIELVEPVARGTGGSNVTVLQILGAAYAEAGRFTDATNATQQALWIAQQQGNGSLAESLKRMLASYAKNQPLRDETLSSKSAVPPALMRPR